MNRKNLSLENPPTRRFPDSKNTRYGKRRVAENRETGTENGQRRRERWIVNALYCRRMPRRKNAIRGEGLGSAYGGRFINPSLDLGCIIVSSGSRDIINARTMLDTMALGWRLRRS